MSRALHVDKGHDTSCCYFSVVQDQSALYNIEQVIGIIEQLTVHRTHKSAQLASAAYIHVNLPLK